MKEIKKVKRIVSHFMGDFFYFYNINKGFLQVES